MWMQNCDAIRIVRMEWDGLYDWGSVMMDRYRLFRKGKEDKEQGITLYKKELL